MTPPVSVVGLGLIGGSLARRLATLGIPAVAWDRDAATRSEAAAAGVAGAPSLAALAARGGMVFVAVPLDQVDAVFAALAGTVPAGTVVSDTTSVKGPVRELARRHGLTFVGGHPMAGTAESGFAAGSADLLAGAPWVLTLDEETDLGAWLAVAGVIVRLGGRVVPATSPAHDAAVAKISHLPHLLAAALVLGAADDPLALSLAAGSFRDATRVAETRPALVAAMCGGNAEALQAAVTALVDRLGSAGEILRRPAALQDWVTAAQVVRRAWPAIRSVELVLGSDESLRRRLLEAGGAGGVVVAVEPGGGVRVMMPGGSAPTPA